MGSSERPSRFAFDSVERYAIMLIAISTIADLAISIYFLSQGTYIVFQNIYYFTIVLASYWYRWRGALFSSVLSASYLSLCAYYDPEFDPFVQAIIRTAIFVLIAFVVAYLSSRLENEKKRYRTIFSTAGSGMVAVRKADHTIIEANNRFLEIVGEGSAEGKKLELFFTDEDLEKLDELLGRDQTVTDIEMHMSLRSGGERECLISGSHLSSNEFAISVIDITERKKAHIAVEDVNRKLHIMSRITRHDTINKLMTLNGHLTIHQKALQDGPERERVERMSDIVESLTDHIDFADNYRRIGINSPEWQSISHTCEEVLTQFDCRNVKIIFETGNVEILADPMLKKVFYNLIDNSLKHGGKVTSIHISSDVGEDIARIVYEDDGVGIPYEKKEKIFEEGYGTDHGLGLFLIKEILKITHVEIIESGTPNIGARFEILVPKGAYRSGKSISQDLPSMSSNN